MEEERPNPDLLLKQIQTEEAEAARKIGKLKIFFGYAAGVGKTYAMLEAAHAAKTEGIDVVAGYIAVSYTHLDGIGRRDRLKICCQQ